MYRPGERLLSLANEGYWGILEDLSWEPVYSSLTCGSILPYNTTMSEKQYYQIRSNGKVVSAKNLNRQSSSFSSKEEAKKVRNTLNGEVPKEKHDHSGSWKFHITPGPDHWRMIHNCYGKRFKY